MEFYMPLVQNIANQVERDIPLTVGVNGAQGTGKSTLSEVIALALEHQHKLRCAVLSIDDIYLTKEERTSLGKTVHPLLETRGVPGTHDVAMGIDLLQNLKKKQSTTLPVFDKATDDRAPKEKWKACSDKVDVIIFEGWCMGATPQDNEDLIEPCNELESSEDEDGKWRTFVNDQLREKYTELFSMLDYLVMLKAPDFECVHEWRSVQEDKLRKKHAGTSENLGNAIMNPDQIKRFISHYERLTHWILKEMPQRADCVLELTPDHRIQQISYLKNDL